MTIAFVEFLRPYTMPGGGVAGPGEQIGFDSVTAANLIAQGVAVSSSAPSAPSPPATTRIQFKSTMMVNNSPPLYNVGDIATFPAATSAALIASGAAIAN